MIPDRLIRSALSGWIAWLGARWNRRRVERERVCELEAALDESLAAEGYPQVGGPV